MKFLRDRKVRDVLWQVLASVGLVAVVVFFVRNASENMVKAGMASGFQFLWRDSGIEVPFNITGYKPSDTILALLWTGIVNTLLVSAAAVVVATVVGFTVGLMRLSHNWLLSTLAAVYVEFVRNIPLLFFVLFWYFGVLSSLPTPKESYDFLGVAFLNRRGLSIPLPNDVAGFRLALLAILVLIGAQFLLARWAGARQARTGQDFPTWLVGFVLCGLLPIVAFVWAGVATDWDVPTPARFQLPRRLRAGAGVRGAVHGAVDLYGGLHRRSRARRHPVGAPGPDRRRAGARPHARPGRAAGRDPAGHAGDHPAHHQPVPQPDQEFLVWRGHRVP